MSAAKQRRKAVNSAKPKQPVNKGSDECDQCDGSGRYLIDGKPQACICSEPQTEAVNDTPCIQCGLPMNGEHKPDCVWAD